MAVYLELHVPDFQPVKTFYGLLGFEILWENGNHGGYLVMQRGETKIAFYGGSDKIYEQSYFKDFSRETKRGYGVEICLHVENLEALYQEIAAHLERTEEGGRIVTPLRLRPWGVQDFRVEDPFGFYLRISAPYDLCEPT